MVTKTRKSPTKEGKKIFEEGRKTITGSIAVHSCPPVEAEGFLGKIGVNKFYGTVNISVRYSREKRIPIPEGHSWLYVNQLGFIIQFVYLNRIYCFHVEPANFEDQETDYWAWWNEFDKYGYGAEREEKGNISFEVRGRMLNKSPSMSDIEINVYHDGVLDKQDERITQFTIFEIANMKKYGKY